jgi:hypothetical protein
VAFEKRKESTSLRRKRYFQYLEIVIEVSVFHHQVAGDNGQREVNLHFGLTSGQHNFFCLVPNTGPLKLCELVHIEKGDKNILILEFHNSLHTAVVVEEIHGADHLCTLYITDSEDNFADCVTSTEFDNLGGCCELGVHFDDRQLQVLENAK